MARQRVTGEDAMALLLKISNIQFEREYRFHPVRRWRFDFAIPQNRIAVEIEGGIYTQGRHTRGSGFAKDCEKYNAATVLGWSVLRYPANQVSSESAEEIKQLIRNKNAKSK